MPEKCSADIDEYAFSGVAVLVSRCEARVQRVQACETQVREDVGGVEVRVVVFELEPVGFAVFVGGWRRFGAEAPGADEAVAIVAVVSAGESFFLACFVFLGSEGYLA